MLLTRKIAFGGLATALVLVSISFSYLSPTADLAFFTLSSFFVAMVVIEADLKTGLMAYAASSVLVTALFGIYYSIPFIVLFGLYPLLKGLLENHLKHHFIAYLLKGVYFCSILAIVLLIFREESTSILTKWNQIFPADLFSTFQSVWALAIAALAVLFLYDYALTLLIVFYHKRIKKVIKPR